MTLNINLTPQLEDMVRQKVAGGLYNSASEVVREALRISVQIADASAGRTPPASFTAT